MDQFNCMKFVSNTLNDNMLRQMVFERFSYKINTKCLLRFSIEIIWDPQIIEMCIAKRPLTIQIEFEKFIFLSRINQVAFKVL